MDAGTLRLDLNPEFIALPDQLRFFQNNLFPIRHNNPISFIPYRLHGMQHLGIFLFHLSHLAQGSQKLIFALNIFANKLTEHLIIIPVIYIQNDLHAAIRHTDTVQLTFPDILTFQLYLLSGNVPDMVHAVHQLFNMENDILFQLMVTGQHFYPLWHIKFDHGERKLIEDIFHDMMDILSFQLFTVNRHHCNLVFFADLIGKCSRLVGVGLCRVEKNDKGLSKFL